MHLAYHLKRAGLLTGPSVKKTRHSNLSVLKDFLIGNAISFGYKAHNNFGSAAHTEFLIKRKSKRKLTKLERKHLNCMLVQLAANVIVQRLMARTICEKRLKFKLNGVPMGGTPDIKQPHTRTISDLKTTVCSSAEDFLYKAFIYGYFRQAITYLRATGYKDFYIIGIQKERPYKVYIVYVNEHIERFKYAEQELAWLLYVYKHYGWVVKPRKKRKTKK